MCKKLKKLKYIDLFAGCGGLSLGLYNSKKWKCHFAIEKSPLAFSTLQHNLIDSKSHFSWPAWLPMKNHDIKDINKNYLEELLSLRGDIDLVCGGPPCQGFSTAGRRNENDGRNGLIRSYIKFIRAVQPKVIFFENVRGFTKQFEKNRIRGRVFSDYVYDQLNKSSEVNDYWGYDLCSKLVDFAEYGIPQRRVRYILVGIRKDISTGDFSQFFSMLDQLKEKFLLEKGLSQNVTLSEAISDLDNELRIESPDSKGFKAGLYGDVKSPYQKYLRNNLKSPYPDSHRFANHRRETVEKFQYILETAVRNKTISEEIKSKFNTSKRNTIPLDGDKTCCTITTLPDDYIHYSQPRILTVREYARIQSFNDWYEFKGKYTTGGKNRINQVPRYSQIGNAVPPLFAELIGRIMYKLLKNA